MIVPTYGASGPGRIVLKPLSILPSVQVVQWENIHALQVASGKPVPSIKQPGILSKNN